MDQCIHLDFTGVNKGSIRIVRNLLDPLPAPSRVCKYLDRAINERLHVLHGTQLVYL